MKIGYARVSTKSQDYMGQIERLEASGCEKIYREKASGAIKRPELDNCLKALRKGDTLVITKLDRLFRSVKELSILSEKLQADDIGLIVIDQQIDTSSNSLSARLNFHLISTLAEFERGLMLERLEEGRERARIKGVRFGAKPKLKPEAVKRMVSEYEAGGSRYPDEFARKFGISRSQFFALLKKEREALKTTV